MTSGSARFSPAQGSVNAPSSLLNWTGSVVSRISDQPCPSFPLIGGAQSRPAFDAFDVWDSWPLQHPNGQTARFGACEYWFMLSAEKFADPGARHDHARIRLVSYEDGVWTDCGNAMPDGYSPGSREWAGSAVLGQDGKVSLYFTAAGRRNQPPTFEQRLFVAQAVLSGSENNAPRLADFAPPQELFSADGAVYTIVRQSEGVPGAIKAFRDPAYFEDPATGKAYILFTGSAGWSDHDYNGVIGVAHIDGTGPNASARLMQPLVSAVGLNNELERPHIVVRGGLYYLFWSTQQRTFDPSGPTGPNGLYAAVANSLAGPWRPVNGSGLVAGNPAEEPIQVYSWWVTGEGEAIGFIDHWGLAGRSVADHPELNRTQFGGTPSPRYRLIFDADHVSLVQ